MKGICDGRVVIVTGAGRGLGREYALEFARQGARVVVNDLGRQRDGAGASDGGPAQAVVDEIRALGGEAITNTDDVADWDGAKRMVRAAIDGFGGLDVLVNNAGILRDRTLANMEPEDWDAVIHVHLRGTFAPSRHATAWWRDEFKAGRGRSARLINTSSSSGLYCNPGQTNYGAAKAGIAAFSIIAARELERYGVMVNAIYPTALSRLTEDIFAASRAKAGESAAAAPADMSEIDPANVAPVIAWLGSEQSEGITGRVFGVRGGRITVAQGWHAGPRAEKHGRWDASELGAIIPDLVRRAAPNALTTGEFPAPRP